MCRFILLKKLDSLYNLVVLSIEDISKIIGRKSKAFWNGQSALQDAKHDLNIITKFNISTVLYTDEDYQNKMILFDRYYHSAVAYRMAEGINNLAQPCQYLAMSTFAQP